MTHSPRRVRGIALMIAAALTGGPLAGCGRSNDAPPPPVDDTRGGVVAQRPIEATSGHHMTTRGKLVLLGGAAAAYYLYKHHQHATAATGVDSQYYLSKNGRVYYRDADHRAHWVTPPAEGIQVPAEEARDYEQYQGYENRTTGRDLVGVGTDTEE